MVLTDGRPPVGVRSPFWPFLLLHPNDNVLICANSADAGQIVMIDNRPHRLTTAVALGHKIARVAMKAGDRVRRYGVPIGSMTRAVAPAEHVHTHNLQSDYISAHGRDAARTQEIRS